MLASLRLCSNTPGQLAIQTALGGYQSIDDLVAPTGRLGRQRDLAYELLSAIPGVSVVKPKAALYMFPAARSEAVSDRRRPAVRLRTARRAEGPDRPGHRLQLDPARPLPDRLPAQRRRPDRGDRAHRALPRALPKAARAVKPIQVGLMGIGTVGSGVFNVLQRNQQEIRRRAGRRIEVTMVSRRDVAAARAIVGDAARVVADPRAIIAEPAIDIVVELIGGLGIARELVLEAIAAGKHVVTANKALLAVHGTEIFAAARERGVMVAFEAAVAGGVPIIKALREGLTANRIESIAGHHQRHDQLHPLGDARQGARLRCRPEGSTAPRLCRGRPELRHRRASMPHTRRRS